MFFRKVCSSVLFCKLFVLLMDDIVMLIVWFGLVNGGSLVCIVIVVMFLILGFVFGFRLMLKLFSIVWKFCLVNGFCLLVLGKFIISL